MCVMTESRARKTYNLTRRDEKMIRYRYIAREYLNNRESSFPATLKARGTGCAFEDRKLDRRALTFNRETWKHLHSPRRRSLSAHRFFLHSPMKSSGESDRSSSRVRRRKSGCVSFDRVKENPTIKAWVHYAIIIGAGSRRSPPAIRCSTC